jgi:PmbA protein
MDIERVEEGIKKVFDTYELYFLKEKQKTFESREKELSGVEIKEETGVALRALKDGRLVFSYAFDGEEAAAALLENARAVLPFVDEDRDAGFPDRFPSYPDPAVYDQEGRCLDDEKKTAMLFDMERAILEYDRRIVTTRNCEFHEAEIEALVINSRGLRAEGRKTLFTMTAMCVAKEIDETSWYDWVWSHSLSELDGRRLGEEIARKAVSFLGSSQLDTGTYAGILTPQAACDLLGILEDSFLAENLYKKKTILADKVDTKCFSPLISIIDSGLVGMGSFPFDGEGVPSRENRLVKDGYFEMFLYNEYYGRKFGRPSTGNAVRAGIKEPPMCSPRGLFIEKGNHALHEGSLDGIIVEELMGTHTANPITGDFSLGAAGYLVKSGSRTPFTGVILSGNLFELFNNIRAVGTDLKFYGSIGSPSLYIEGLTISGR